MGYSKQVFLDMQEQLASMANQAEDGEINEMALYAELSELEKNVKATKERVKEWAVREFDTYGEKTVSFENFLISKSASGRHSYTNNPQWVATKNTLSDIEKKMQIAYKSESKVYIDPETGEVFEASEYKPNKESLSIKIKK